MFFSNDMLCVVLPYKRHKSLFAANHVYIPIEHNRSVINLNRGKHITYMRKTTK